MDHDGSLNDKYKSTLVSFSCFPFTFTFLIHSSPAARMISSRVLIVGANGAVGRELLHQLRALCPQPQIRVSTRNAAAIAGKFPPGVEVVQGDLSDVSSYHRLFTGVDRAFLYSTPEAPLEQLFTAAKDKGVRHVTILSSLSVEDDPDGMIGTAQRKVEDAIVNAGLLFYTFIRAGNFCSNASLFLASSD